MQEKMIRQSARLLLRDSRSEAVTVFDILAKRNADKLRAVRADGASIRYHLRMDGSEAGAIDVFELFNGVSLAFNSIP